MAKTRRVIGWTCGNLAAFALVGIVSSPGVSVAQNHAQRTTQVRTQMQGPAQRPQSAVPAVRSAPVGTRVNAVGAAGAGVPVAAAGVQGAHGTHATRPRPVAASAGAAGLRQALTTFQLDMGRMPTTEEGLEALIRAPAGARNWRGPYISVVSGRAPFTDPWGNPYQLINTSRGAHFSFTIRSNGPDGLPNTADDITISG